MGHVMWLSRAATRERRAMRRTAAEMRRSSQENVPSVPSSRPQFPPPSFPQFPPSSVRESVCNSNGLSNWSHEDRMPLKITAGILFAGACASLYFGTGWLFMMPHFPGEGYFTLERMLYGIGPMLLSGALLVSVGWTWTRSGTSLSLRKAIISSFRWAMAAVILFWSALMVIGGIRQGWLDVTCNRPRLLWGAVLFRWPRAVHQPG